MTTDSTPTSEATTNPLNDPQQTGKSKWIAIGIGALIPFIVIILISIFKSNGSGNNGSYADVDWLLFRELDLQTGRPSERLAALDGKPVRAPGFMVPLEDNRSDVTEFLLVPNAQACIHAPPPPTNQMVYVRMVKGPAKMVFGPVQVEGTLRVSSQAHQYGNAGFQLYGDFVEPYRN